MNFQLVPPRAPEEIVALVEGQIRKIESSSVAADLRSFLVPPRLEHRDWGWARPIESYPVWVIAESTVYDYCLLYSDYGFAPENPWGLGFSSHQGFDADYCWYPSLEKAFTESRLPEESAPDGLRDIGKM